MDKPPDFSYSLLSSLRYDDALLHMAWNTRINGGTPSPFMLLPYHLDRLMAAVRDHGWHLPALAMGNLQTDCEAAVRSAQDQHSVAPLKIRVLVAHDGTLSASASPAAPLASSDYLAPPNHPHLTRTIYIDSQATPTSLYTWTKTTHRPIYNAARARAGLTPLPQPSDAHIDVLLYNSDGLVTETSIRNVAFRRGDQWVTPRSGSGCLPGVARRALLEEGRIVEGDIRKEELGVDEIVLTFNGVEGCCLGRLSILPSSEIAA